MPTTRRLILVLLCLVFLLIIVRSGGKNSIHPSDRDHTLTSSRVNSNRYKAASSLDKIEPVRGSSDIKKLSTEDANSEAMSSRLREAESLAKENANKKAPSREAVMGDVDEANSEEHKYHAGIQELVTKDPENPNIANVPVSSGPTQNRSLRKTPEPVEVRQKTPAEIEEDEDIKDILNQMLKRAPVVIFSKSYCPHSKKAKHYLTDVYHIEPSPYIVELDIVSHGLAIQALLADTTKRNTVPNVLIRGRTLGGGDEIQALHEKGKLGEKISEYCGTQCTKVRYMDGKGKSA